MECYGKNAAVIKLSFRVFVVNEKGRGGEGREGFHSTISRFLQYNIGAAGN